MLSTIKIRNYKSIQEIILNLSFDEAAPNNYEDLDHIPFIYNNSRTDSRIVPVMNIYGANASGKSSFIEALKSFKNVLNKGVRTKTIISIPNKIKDMGNFTEVSLEFYIEKKLYRYSIEYGNSSIEIETLEEFHNAQKEYEILFSTNPNKFNFKGIASTISPAKNLKQIYISSCTSAEDGTQLKPFLTSLVEAKPGHSKKLNQILNFLNENISVLKNNIIGPQIGISKLSKSSRKEDLAIAVQKIGKVVKQFDIDIDEFKYSQEEFPFNDFEDFEKVAIRYKEIRINKNKNLLIASELKTIRKDISGNSQIFDMTDESNGTQRLFGLIGYVLKVLETGGVLIVDEIDSALHSFVLKSIIKLFKDKDLNKNKAQIICTLHNTDILNEKIYRKSEFAFVNKNKKDGSFIRKMSEYEDIRNESKFREKYLNGFFYGIPYLQI